MAKLHNDPTPCTIERLSGCSALEGRRVLSTFYRFVHQRLLLATCQPLSASSVVTVEQEDVLFFEEAVACTPEQEGLWQVLIRVHQILNGLQSLTILRERLLWREGHSRLLPLTESSILVAS